MKESNLYDSSGLKLYYTPKIRKYDLGTLTTGQLLLELPPSKNEVNCCLDYKLFIFIIYQ